MRAFIFTRPFFVKWKTVYYYLDCYSEAFHSTILAYSVQCIDLYRKVCMLMLLEFKKNVIFEIAAQHFRNQFPTIKLCNKNSDNPWTWIVFKMISYIWQKFCSFILSIFSLFETNYIISLKTLPIKPVLPVQPTGAPVWLWPM